MVNLSSLFVRARGEERVAYLPRLSFCNAKPTLTPSLHPSPPPPLLPCASTLFLTQLSPMHIACCPGLLPCSPQSDDYFHTPDSVVHHCPLPWLLSSVFMLFTSFLSILVAWSLMVMVHCQWSMTSVKEAWVDDGTQVVVHHCLWSWLLCGSGGQLPSLVEGGGDELLLSEELPWHEMNQRYNRERLRKIHTNRWSIGMLACHIRNLVVVMLVWLI